MRLNYLTLSDYYKMGFAQTDGQDPEHIAHYTQIICRNLPGILELTTWRHYEHCGVNRDDNLGYRDTETHAAWLDADPLKVRDASTATALQTEIEEAFAYATAT